MQQIERVVDDGDPFGLRMMQGLKRRTSCGLERHDFAVENGVLRMIDAATARLKAGTSCSIVRL